MMSVPAKSELLDQADKLTGNDAIVPDLPENIAAQVAGVVNEIKQVGDNPEELRQVAGNIEVAIEVASDAYTNLAATENESGSTADTPPSVKSVEKKTLSPVLMSLLTLIFTLSLMLAACGAPAPTSGNETMPAQPTTEVAKKEEDEDPGNVVVQIQPTSEALEANPTATPQILLPKTGGEYPVTDPDIDILNSLSTEFGQIGFDTTFGLTPGISVDSEGGRDVWGVIVIVTDTGVVVDVSTEQFGKGTVGWFDKKSGEFHASSLEKAQDEFGKVNQDQDNPIDHIVMEGGRFYAKDTNDEKAMEWVDGSWVMIEGYEFQEVVSSQIETQPVSGTMYIQEGGCNFRDVPSTVDNVPIKYLDVNQEVTLIKEALTPDDQNIIWVYVKVGEQEGWVSRNVLNKSLIEESAPNPQAPEQVAETIPSLDATWPNMESLKDDSTVVLDARGFKVIVNKKWLNYGEMPMMEYVNDYNEAELLEFITLIKEHVKGRQFPMVNLSTGGFEQKEFGDKSTMDVVITSEKHDMTKLPLDGIDQRIIWYGGSTGEQQSAFGYFFDPAKPDHVVAVINATRTGASRFKNTSFISLAMGPLFNFTVDPQVFTDVEVIITEGKRDPVQAAGFTGLSDEPRNTLYLEELYVVGDSGPKAPFEIAGKDMKNVFVN
jgi:hypothetical protein